MALRLATRAEVEHELVTAKPLAEVVAEIERDDVVVGELPPLVAAGPFDEAKHPRVKSGQKGGGRFTVKENAAGRFEVVNPEGTKVAETTDEVDAEAIKDEKNAPAAVEGPFTYPSGWTGRYDPAEGRYIGLDDIYMPADFDPHRDAGSAIVQPAAPSTDVRNAVNLANNDGGVHLVDLPTDVLQDTMRDHSDLLSPDGRESVSRALASRAKFGEPTPSERRAQGILANPPTGDDAMITNAVSDPGRVVDSGYHEGVPVADLPVIRQSLHDELIQRADQMFDTEFSVKSEKLRQAGGWWPRGLSDWETQEGRAIREEIALKRVLASAEEPCQECIDIVASIPVKPPLEWFDVPEPDVPTPITVTSDGHIYGHAAIWGTCHLGNPRGPGRCVTPPVSQTDYSLFHLGEVETDGGDRVHVGQITLDTGHAPIGMAAQTAAAHYDNTGTVVADVRARNGELGVWYSGALRPDITPERVRALTGSKISGDWRGGEMVGMLCVNVPGFPVPRAQARLVASADGEEEVLALVAAGIVGEEPPSERILEIRVATLCARAEGIDALTDLALA